MINPVSLSEYASVAITIAALTFAAICDLKTREVTDNVWLVYGPVGLALTIYRTYVSPTLLIITAVSIGFSVLVAFGLVFFGLWGGADAKALMCLGVSLPLAPTAFKPVLGFVHPFFPIVVLVTGYLCSFSVAIWMLSKNLILLGRFRSRMFDGFERDPAWKKALAFITGFPAQLTQLQSTFYLYPMEKVIVDSEGAHRSLQTYSNADIDRDQVLSAFNESLRKVGSPETVWVTPGLPMLVFILFAALITLMIGDPVFAGIFLLLSKR